MKIKLFLLYTLCTLFLNIIAKSTNNEIALETVSTKKTNPIDENKNSFRKRFIKALQKKIKGSPKRYVCFACSILYEMFFNPATLTQINIYDNTTMAYHSKSTYTKNFSIFSGILSLLFIYDIAEIIDELI